MPRQSKLGPSSALTQFLGFLERDSALRKKQQFEKKRIENAQKTASRNRLSKSIVGAADSIGGAIVKSEQIQREDKQIEDAQALKERIETGRISQRETEEAGRAQRHAAGLESAQGIAAKREGRLLDKDEEARSLNLAKLERGIFEFDTKTENQKKADTIDNYAKHGVFLMGALKNQPAVLAKVLPIFNEHAALLEQDGFDSVDMDNIVNQSAHLIGGVMTQMILPPPEPAYKEVGAFGVLSLPNGDIETTVLDESGQSEGDKAAAKRLEIDRRDLAKAAATLFPIEQQDAGSLEFGEEAKPLTEAEVIERLNKRDRFVTLGMSGLAPARIGLLASKNLLDKAAITLTARSDLDGPALEKIFQAVHPDRWGGALNMLDPELGFSPEEVIQAVNLPSVGGGTGGTPKPSGSKPKPIPEPIILTANTKKELLVEGQPVMVGQVLSVIHKGRVVPAALINGEYRPIIPEG